MALNLLDIEDGTHNPPQKPEGWLSDVANKAFYLCYVRARYEYNAYVKQNEAFEKLPTEKQGQLCAKTMIDLLEKGYIATYGEKAFNSACEHHETSYENSPLGKYFTYE